ncbi:MAG: hypothetical protein LBO66_06555 [Deltaproteobacteria bacterium]|jgi:hypothetical protein|nr:hypothetical protein [Deltaproteobacteria bacterium]
MTFSDPGDEREKRPLPPSPASPPLRPSDPAPSVGEDGLVTVTLLGERYHIRSDNPELILSLSDLVLSHAREALGRLAKAPPDLALMVQASFRLALSLHNAQKELASSRERAEALSLRLQALLDLIDQSLEN